MLGVTVPMVGARAEMIVTEPLPLMPMGGADGNGLYGRQTLRGNLAYGGGPHEWLDDEPTTSGRASTPLMRNLALRLGEMFPCAATWPMAAARMSGWRSARGWPPRRGPARR